MIKNKTFQERKKTIVSWGSYFLCTEKHGVNDWKPVDYGIRITITAILKQTVTLSRWCKSDKLILSKQLFVCREMFDVFCCRRRRGGRTEGAAEVQLLYYRHIGRCGDPPSVESHETYRTVNTTGGGVICQSLLRWKVEVDGRGWYQLRSGALPARVLKGIWN